VKNRILGVAGAALAASLLAAPAPAQMMVVNEVVAEPAPAFVEVLILEDGNYQNWSIVDCFASGTIGAGGVQFSGPGYANLRAGTVIVFYGLPTTSAPPADPSYDPDNGDWIIEVNEGEPSTGDFAITGDAAFVLGTGTNADCILIGDGTPAGSIYNPPFANVTDADFVPEEDYYDPATYKFGIVSDRAPHNTRSPNDVILGQPLSGAAIGGSFTQTADYTIGVISPSPGQPNAFDNQQYILGLRNELPGVSIFVPEGPFFSRLTLPTDEEVVEIPVSNPGDTDDLVVSGSFITGPDASLFSVVEPLTVAPGGSASLPVIFSPQGAKGQFQATLTIVSNDEDGATVDVGIVGHSGDHADYEGLLIVELSDAPDSFRDEFVEIQNTTAAPMDISGVILSDEEFSNGEGTIRFPAGSVLDPGEIAIVLVGGTTAFTPNFFLDPNTLEVLLDPGVTVYYQSNRDVSGYPSLPDNPLVEMEYVPAEEFGASGVVFFAAADSAALHLPGSPWVLGPVNFNSAIDGVNFNKTATAPEGPINSNGDADTLQTRVGDAALSGVQSYARRVIDTNVSSEVTFRVQNERTPGQLNVLDDPDASAVSINIFVDRVLPTGAIQALVPIQNLGAAADLTIAGSFFTGADATLFSVVSEPAGPLGPDEVGDVAIEFAPNGFVGSATATLNVVSNDSSGDIVEVTIWAYSGDPADYDGLWMSEIKYTPAIDQFVEIVNTSSSSIDISGVGLTDSNAGNTEGSIRFPAGTVLAPGEVILVTASPQLGRPNWIDNVPPGVRVFVNPARVEGAEFWFPAGGNQLVNMENDIENGNGIFWTSGTDNVAMYFPGARIFSGVGLGIPSTVLDGFNFAIADPDSKPVPLNPDGDYDTPETRFDIGAGVPTSVIRRVYDYSTSSQDFWEVDQVGITPGELRTVDDPDVQVASLQAFAGRALPNATSTGAVTVRNNGFTAPLTVSGSFFTGANASLFSVTSEPSGIVAGETGDLSFTFDPQGFTGPAEATLTVVSNDGGGDTINVTVHAFSGDPAPYAGLWLSEVKVTPTADQFVEIVNLSGSVIDISGVQLTDSGASNTEGCIAFPAGTTIAPGEHIVVTAGAGTALGLERPSWIDGIAGSTRVFVNPFRVEAAEFWFPANGNQLINMDNVPDNENNGAGVFWLGSTDEVAMTFPGARIFNGVGLGVPGTVLDGLNLANTATGKPVPINPDGLYDTQASRLDVTPGIATSAIRKTYATSTSSQIFWATPSSAITPGAENPEITNVDDWSLLAY
jgi:hypothetical protein